MNIVNVKIEEVKPYKNNPRINGRAIKVVADSIREFGFKNPIVVDKDMEIIVGHTRLEASKVLGLKEVPVIIADDLNEEQVRAFRIMDNKSSEFAEWDYGKLIEEIQELKSNEYDVDLTGFNDVEIEEMVNEFLEDEEKRIEDEKPEIEYTSELLEEHNYVVLYFDNALDWQTAKDIFGVKSVQALASREGFEKVGTGRVIDGKPILERLKGESKF